MNRRNLKAVRMNRNRLLIVIALCVILFIMVLFIGILVAKEIKFRASLPNPDEATEMVVYHTASGSVVFKNGDFSVVSLGKNAKFSDYLGLAGNHVDVLFLTDTTETTFDNLTETYVYGSVDTIYVPSGANKVYMERLKEHYEDRTKIVRLKKKGEKFVLNEFVVRVFDVTEGSIAFSLTHGHDNFLVAQEEGHNLKALKNTSLKAVFAPLQAAKELEKVDYYVCKVAKDAPVPATEEVSGICIQYCVPGSRLLYGLQLKDELIFDASFTLTGKLQ